MRVPTDLLKSVVYLGGVTNLQGDPANSTADMVFAGTGVWVSVPGANGGSYTHLVTSKHVVDDMKDCDWGIRANTKSGEANIIPCNDAKWVFHDDETVDIAVLPWSPPPSQIDYKLVPQATFAEPGMTLWHQKTNECLERPVEVGDEVAIVGLLKFVPGDKVNMPIARFGNLSLVPSEPIPWKGKMVNVYLVESRSIGGLSGSPVFVEIAPETPDSEIFLLGIVRGHWDKGAVNIGIGLVEPSRLIKEILNKPELAQMRKKLDEGANSGGTLLK